MNFKINSQASSEDVDFLYKKMDEYNSSLLPDENPRDVNIIVHDDDGNFIGGLAGSTSWHNFLIKALWLEEKFRTKGIGKKVVVKAEIEASSLGCLYSMVGTFEALNARAFYEKCGYELVSEAKVEPIEQTGYFFYKKLNPI